jgi:hypothetical protein
MTPEQHAYLTSRISAYADKYEFKVRTRTMAKNPHDAAVRELAHQYAEKWGNRYGYSPDSPEVITKYIDLCSDQIIQEEARNLLQKRQATTNAALVGLL